MMAILDWLDGAAPPRVTLDSPKQCQVLAPGTTYLIRWSATDARIPVDGVDIFYSTNSGTNWIPIASGEPNDGLYTWTVPSISSSSVRFRVAVRDSTMAATTTASASDFIISSATTGLTCNLQFTGAPGNPLGWRLVSFPFIPTNPDASAILSSLGTNYAGARAYVSSDASDPWKSINPASGSRDLATLDQSMAFWVDITGPATLSVTGDLPIAPQRIAMNAGWNLVGFPTFRAGYTIADLKAATGATRVEGFDETATPYFLQVLPDTYVMALGEGYWVYVPAPTTWNVPL